MITLNTKILTRAGWLASALSAALLLASAAGKLWQPPGTAAVLAQIGYTPALLPPIAALELFCTVLYLIPRTSVLGAVLLTGYLGGAISAHVRVYEPFVGPLLIGLLLWAGIWARRPDLRRLLPLVTSD